MIEANEENDPFEEDIVFDQTGLLGSNHPYTRQQASGFLPTFMLFIRTVFLCVVFVSLGLCASISQGPIIHLEVAVGLPVTMAFHTFTAQSIGMLIGGLLGSTLFDIYNRQFLIFVSLMWVAVSIAILPFTIPVSFWWTLATLTAIGAGMSFIFTGSNVLCLDLWGKQGGASLQSLHFSFAVGAFIAPIVIHPLLLGPYRPQFNDLLTRNLTGEPFKSLPHNQRFIRSAIYSNDSIFNAGMPTLLKLPSGENLDSLTLPRDKKEPIYANGTDNFVNLKTSNVSESVVNKYVPVQFGNSTFTNITKGNSSNVDILEVAPKPKPSFTNANILPDQKVWKKPKKERLGQSLPNLTTIKPDEANKFSTIPNEIMTVNSSITSALLSTDADSHTNSVSTGTEQEYASSTIISTLELSEPLSTISLLKTDNMKNFTKSALTSKNVVSFNDATTTTVSLPDVLTIINTLQPIEGLEKNESSIKKVAFRNNSVVEIKYPIDFSINNESDYTNNGQGAMYHDDFTDFTDNINSKPLSEPLMDSKETLFNHVENNETSAITVTASFADSDISTHHQIHQFKPGTYSNISDSSNLRLLQNIVDKFKNYGISSVHVVYICTGIFILLIAFISVCIMCHNPREPRSRQEEGIVSNLHRTRMYIFICGFSIYMFTAEALQGAVHHLLASSLTENGMPVVSKAIGGQAMFWGLVCGVRFLCIIGSGCFRIKPGKILVASTLFMVMGSVFLCIGTFDKKDFLWGGIFVVALGLAPVLPTCFLWMAGQMKVTHKMCALMIIISSFGNSLTHTTLTHVLANSHLYSYILIGISVCSLLFLTFSFCFIYKSQSSKSLAVPVGYQLANQEEDESMELSRPNARNFDNINRRLSDMGEAGQALLID